MNYHVYVSKLIALVNNNINFKNWIFFCLKNQTMDMDRLKKAYSYWKTSFNDEEVIRFNEKFLKGFLAPFKIRSFEEEFIILTIVFLLKTTYKKCFPSLEYFIFATSSLNGVIEEKGRLERFFESEIKGLFEIIDEAISLTPILMELLNIFEKMEKEDLKEQSPEILKREGLWDLYQKIQHLCYFYPDPINWVENLERIRYILKDYLKN